MVPLPLLPDPIAHLDHGPDPAPQLSPSGAQPILNIEKSYNVLKDPCPYKLKIFI